MTCKLSVVEIFRLLPSLFGIFEVVEITYVVDFSVCLYPDIVPTVLSHLNPKLPGPATFRWANISCVSKRGTNAEIFHPVVVLLSVFVVANSFVSPA